MRNDDWRGDNNKALAIIRISSRRQKDGVSHDVQEREVREYCSEHGLVLVELIKLTESAKHDEKRKHYSSAIAKALSEPYRHILFYMHDREARNMIDIEQNEKLVKADLLVLHYVRERKVLFKDAPDSDFLMRDFQAVTNKHYSRNLSSKVNDAMKEKAESGWYPSNNPPLGYRPKPAVDQFGRQLRRGGTIDADPDERKVRQVNLEFELRAKGYSYEAIRAEVVKQGFIPEKRLSQYRATSIQHRIANPFYWGRFTWKGKEYDGNHPLIIPKQILVCVKTVERGKKILLRGTEHGIFGGGWLKCSECDCNIVYDPKVKKYRSGASKTYHYYHCSNGRKIHASLAGLNVEESDIWAQFDQVVDSITMDEATSKRVAKALNDNQMRGAAQAKVKLIKAEDALRRVLEREDQLLDMLMTGDVDQAAYKRKVQILRDERGELQTQIEQAKGEIRGQKGENYASIIELCKHAKSLYLSRSAVERRDFLENVLSNPRLKGLSVEYDLKNPFSEIVKLGDFVEWRARLEDYRTNPGSKVRLNPARRSQR